MASNGIKIFDDTVIKLSVNQGLEAQRTTEILGNFTSGELAFTRDTGRLFVGDNSDGEGEHVGIQETIGGSLVGNKYLGLIDSKPLVVFKNNGEALSYENETQYTGTQEAVNFVEPGLLTEGSKFRLHSDDPKWDNWDRSATYNPKYNAYNGDFMFDVYQNALILFDNRISGEPDSPYQPEIKMGDNGLPVTPETFIVDGKEIPSNSVEALSLTRRTQLKNYAKLNDQITNSNMVYGDGYVIMRMVEPDNQTIRFKVREFQDNGLPVGINNYSHNILEVFHVPTESIIGSFSDDFFASGSIIYLHKDIKNVDSITGNGGMLRIPGKLYFSYPKQPRGATTYMEWDINEPSDEIIFPDDQGTKYILTLSPYAQKTDGGQTYLAFNANIEKNESKTYTIKLKGDLYSDQQNRETLVIDDTATDLANCPTLEYIGDKSNELSDGETDPFLTDNGSEETFYTGNLGLDSHGRVQYIDSLDPTTMGASLDKVKKWEETNTSVNFLKTPVTLAQSSAAKNLYKNPSEPTASDYTVQSTLSASTNGSDSISNDYKKMIKKVTAVNKLIVAANKSGSASTSGIMFSNKVLTISSLNTEGVGVAFSGNNIATNSHVSTININGNVTGFDSAVGTCQIFAALVDASVNTDIKILSVQQLKNSLSNFAFNILLDTHTVVLNTGVFLVLGAIFDLTSGTASNIKVEYKTISLNQALSQDAEQLFMLSDVGVNANLDFNVSPYVYCAKKLVSCPYASILPKPDNTTFPGTGNGAYFSKFENNGTIFIKTWNNLFKVLGHNHYKDLANGGKSDIITTESSKYNTVGAAFKSFLSYEFDPETKSIKNHDKIDDDSDTLYMAWAWYKEYTKSNDTETNVKYYPLEEFDVRDTIISEDEDDKEIKYAKLSNGQYIFGGNAEPKINGDIKESDEEEIEKNRYIKLQCIYAEASCLDNVTYIEYGSEDGLKAIYDFKKEKLLEFYNTLEIEDVEKIVLINGTGNVEITSPKTTAPFSADDPVSTIGGTNGDKISDYNYIAFGQLDEEGKEVVYTVYKIEKNCQFVTGFNEPGTLSSVKIFVENDSNGNGGSIVTGNLNESLIEDEKVYIPTTARNILLEITHVTTDNNTFAIFYANKFDDLAILHSGYKTKEWNDPVCYSSDITLNPSYDQPFTDGNFTNGNGGYRLTLGKSISTVDATKFHSLESTPNTECPSVFAPAPNEKCLFNSSVTETKVIEVPLHTIPGSDIRHFALRFANIRPSDTNVLNQVVVRVIGYRV